MSSLSNYYLEHYGKRHYDPYGLVLLELFCRVSLAARLLEVGYVCTVHTHALKFKLSFNVVVVAV